MSVIWRRCGWNGHGVGHGGVVEKWLRGGEKCRSRLRGCIHIPRPRGNGVSIAVVIDAGRIPENLGPQRPAETLRDQHRLDGQGCKTNASRSASTILAGTSVRRRRHVAFSLAALPQFDLIRTSGACVGQNACVNRGEKLE